MIPQQQFSAYDPEIARDKMTQFLQVMARFETLSWKNIIDITTVGVWDVAERDYLFLKTREWKREGKQPKDVEGLDIRLRSAVASSFHIADRFGIGTGSMVFDLEDSYDDYHIYNQNLIIENIDEGSFARISGPPRKGKTNPACVMIERWLEDGNLCFTNIYMKKKVEGITYVNDARALRQAGW